MSGSYSRIAFAASLIAGLALCDMTSYSAMREARRSWRGSRATRVGMRAEALAAKVPKAQVVAAFQTIPSEVLFDVFEGRGDATRPSMVYCGDQQKAKRVAVTLIRDAGFDPVDAGPLRIARYIEPFALLVAQLAYEGEGSAELAYRFERFGG